MIRPAHTTALAALAACAALGACGRQAATAPEQAATAPAAAAGSLAVEPPALWSVETAQAGVPARTVLVCADKAVRTAFSQSLPSPDGTPCVILGQPVLGEGRFSARCRAGGTEFAVHSDTQGDPLNDFNVQTAISADTTPPRSFEQTLRFRRIGACPAGWAVGDSAAPGERRIVNALSGQSRDSETPAPSL